MAQATNDSVLGRIFARFQAKRAATTTNTQNTPQEIDDPANPGRKIPNPAYKAPTKAPDNPTDLFAGLFNTPSQQNTKAPPKFTLPREKIMEAAGKQDFLADLPEDLRNNLNSDGGLTVENISAMMHHVARNAYARAVEHNSSLTDHYVNARLTHEQENLPTQLRSLMAKNRTVANTDNPVVREHLAFISERIASQFPDASEEEIADMSREYFTTMAREINPNGFNTQQPNNRNQNNQDGFITDVQDYDSYLQGTKTLDQARQAMPDQTQQRS